MFVASTVLESAFGNEASEKVITQFGVSGVPFSLSVVGPSVEVAADDHSVPVACELFDFGFEGGPGCSDEA